MSNQYTLISTRHQGMQEGRLHMRTDGLVERILSTAGEKTGFVSRAILHYHSRIENAQTIVIEWLEELPLYIGSKELPKNIPDWLSIPYPIRVFDALFGEGSIVGEGWLSDGKSPASTAQLTVREHRDIRRQLQEREDVLHAVLLLNAELANKNHAVLEWFAVGRQMLRQGMARR